MVLVVVWPPGLCLLWFTISVDRHVNNKLHARTLFHNMPEMRDDDIC